MLNQETRKSPPKRGLGRGLASLLPTAFSDELAGNTSGEAAATTATLTKQPTSTPTFSAQVANAQAQENLPKPGEKTNHPYFFTHIDDVVPNPNQPRKYFDEAALKELSQSIQIHGVLSPIVVRQKGPHYEIIAGERRWRASKKAGLTKIPVLLKEVGDKAQFQLALVENIQRNNLTPIEEAIGYEHLMEAYNWTQEKVADQVGKDRTTITNSLRLLKLPQPVQDLINTGQLTAGHAKALLGLTNPEDIKTFAQKIVSLGLSVRAVENEFKKDKIPSRLPMQKTDNPLIKDLERKIESALKMKTEIQDHGQKGILKIHFASHTELNKLLEKMGVI